ncbi:FHA domain-containing protein [Herbiconiux sp. L3-i23]|uniref:FHA domain-containing protein n=1 Tax=Herbiconiux sp. L3-i23 TaxID=2905871 RepID=UPI002069105A|nr:FHA domain-containing protein [Herbiconiux sp. L3-i23]BDI21820.1 hypothetical protein L3i23_05960 [Herbiconiux sp. L3-i23]
MSERGFITPPPGLLPEPPQQPAAAPAADPEPRTALPVFFPAPPGAAPIASEQTLSEETATEQTAADRTVAEPVPALMAGELTAAVPVAAPEQAFAPVAASSSIASGAESGWSVELEGTSVGPLPDVLVLGRAPVSTIPGARALAVTGGGTVSKTHAVIRRDGDAVTIEDLGSTNGTAVEVDGARILLTPNQPYRLERSADLWLSQARVTLRTPPAR